MTDKGDNPEPEPIIATLVEEWAALEALLDGLDTSEWWMPTLPGWSVHDVVAHLIDLRTFARVDCWKPLKEVLLSESEVIAYASGRGYSPAELQAA